MTFFKILHRKCAPISLIEEGSFRTPHPWLGRAGIGLCWQRKTEVTPETEPRILPSSAQDEVWSFSQEIRFSIRKPPGHRHVIKKRITNFHVAPSRITNLSELSSPSLEKLERQRRKEDGFWRTFPYRASLGAKCFILNFTQRHFFKPGRQPAPEDPASGPARINWSDLRRLKREGILLSVSVESQDECGVNWLKSKRINHGFELKSEPPSKRGNVGADTFIPSNVAQSVSHMTEG